MRKTYHFPQLTKEQRLFLEYLLLEQIEKQAWYAIVRFSMFKTESLICIQ